MLLPVSMYTGGNTSADMNRESKPHVIRSVGSMGLEVRAGILRKWTALYFGRSREPCDLGKLCVMNSGEESMGPPQLSHRPGHLLSLLCLSQAGVKIRT